MARFTGIILALGLLALAAPVRADGPVAANLGSLQGVGSTQQLSQPTGGTTGRVGGIAVDPSDPSGARHFNGVPNRISQGDTDAADAAPPDRSGRLLVGTDQGVWGSANGGVWKTTNGGSNAGTGGPGVGFLRSMDGGKTWAAQAGDGGLGGHNTGALRNVGSGNMGSTTPAGPATLRAKAN